jgi:hypothetical protein
MTKDKKLLKDLEKDAVEQEDKRHEIEESDNIEGEELDPEKAPGVETMDEMSQKWKAQEKEREIIEGKPEEDAGSDIEQEEEEGEEPYPEIEEEMNREDKTDSEREADEEEKEQAA